MFGSGPFRTWRIYSPREAVNMQLNNNTSLAIIVVSAIIALTVVELNKNPVKYQAITACYNAGVKDCAEKVK